MKKRVLDRFNRQNYFWTINQDKKKRLIKTAVASSLATALIVSRLMTPVYAADEKIGISEYKNDNAVIFAISDSDDITDETTDGLTDETIDGITDGVTDGITDEVTDGITDTYTDENTDGISDYNSYDFSDEISDEWNINVKDWGVELQKINEKKEEQKDLSDQINIGYKIEISCNSETEQEILYNELIERGIICRLLTL